MLIVCVYLPADSGSPDSCDDFLFNSSELNSFIEYQSFDNLILHVVGDFNVDLDCGGMNTQLLNLFMDELNLGMMLPLLYLLA